MRIVRKMMNPSREDAVRITQSEKTDMILLAYVVASLQDFPKEMAQRLGMVDGGVERMTELGQKAEELLTDIRVTIPMNQRQSLQNIEDDFEMRVLPKATPSVTNAIMTKEEFRTLVDCARVKCMECTEDDRSCEKCKLYQLLTNILPLDDYHSYLLCPYNLGEWKN